MMRGLLGVVAVAALSLAQPALSAPANYVAKHHHHVTRHWHGYGFLPGYRPPEVMQRQRAAHYYRLYGPQYYGPAWPRYFRGRWNGGGFGPCYTQTPIGPMWNCGR